MKLKAPILSDPQIVRLANMSSDLSLVFVASAVLPPVFGKFDTNLFIKGIIFALTFAVISLRLSK